MYVCGCTCMCRWMCTNVCVCVCVDGGQRSTSVVGPQNTASPHFFTNVSHWPISLSHLRYMVSKPQGSICLSPIFQHGGSKHILPYAIIRMWFLEILLRSSCLHGRPFTSGPISRPFCHVLTPCLLELSYLESDCPVAVEATAVRESSSLPHRASVAEASLWAHMLRRA